MIFHKTGIPGVFAIELEFNRDARGFFARSWCENEFKSHGLTPRIAQCNISFNERKGALFPTLLTDLPVVVCRGVKRHQSLGALNA
jgi:hypothetical protein